LIAQAREITAPSITLAKQDLALLKSIWQLKPILIARQATLSFEYRNSALKNDLLRHDVALSPGA
jgi:hypothetical protein